MAYVHAIREGDTIRVPKTILNFSVFVRFAFGSFISAEFRASSHVSKSLDGVLELYHQTLHRLIVSVFPQPSLGCVSANFVCFDFKGRREGTSSNGRVSCGMVACKNDFNVVGARINRFKQPKTVRIGCPVSA